MFISVSLPPSLSISASCRVRHWRPLTSTLGSGKSQFLCRFQLLKVCYLPLGSEPPPSLSAPKGGLLCSCYTASSWCQNTLCLPLINVGPTGQYGASAPLRALNHIAKPGLVRSQSQALRVMTGISLGALIQPTPCHCAVLKRLY